MIPTGTPEFVIGTHPGLWTGDEILITNKGNQWIKGSDDRTGARNGELIGGRLIIPK